jgi:hypothetical protein
MVLASDKSRIGGKYGKYVCLICVWLYDPTKGDPDGDIKPVYLLKSYLMVQC